MPKRIKYLLIVLPILILVVAFVFTVYDYAIRRDLRASYSRLLSETGKLINFFSTSAGALSLTAGGVNQNITLTPSGTGFTILNGKVGIGTMEPVRTLHVSTGETGTKFASNVIATLRVQDAGKASTFQLSDGTNQAAHISYLDGESTPRISIGGASEAVTILLDSGRVGIGTIKPTSLLTIEPSTTTATSTVEISNKGSITNGSCIQMHSPNGTRYRLYVSNGGVLITEAGKCQ